MFLREPLQNKTDWFFSHLLITAILKCYLSLLLLLEVFMDYASQLSCRGQQGLHTIWICNPYVTQHSISSQTPLNVCSLACFSNLVRPVVLITESLCPNDISMADSRSPPAVSLADGFRLPCTGAHTCVHAHQKRSVLILLLGCFIMINGYIWQLFFPALEKTHDQMLKRESAKCNS